MFTELWKHKCLWIIVILIYPVCAAEVQFDFTFVSIKHASQKNKIRKKRDTKWIVFISSKTELNLPANAFLFHFMH